MTWLEIEKWILISILVMYGSFEIIQIIIYLTTPRRESPKSFADWHVGFWFDKKMKLRKKFAILGLHLLVLYLITIIFRLLRILVGEN